MSVIETIKKMLRIAHASSGATEAEAHNAMQMASALMLKHNVQVDLDDEQDAPTAIKGNMIRGFDDDWHRECASAAGYLYSCRVLQWKGCGGIAFVGRPDNIAACQDMAIFLTAEVERLYKLALPKGMSKENRTNFRRSFKFACGRRLAARAWAIMETLRQDDLKAIEATGSKALVVVQSIDAQLAEADALMTGIPKAVVKSTRATGLGTEAGRRAGDSVQLQKQVTS